MKPAVRYGVATCIQSGWIVAVHGPFPAGQWPDQNIFKHCLVPNLDQHEMVEVDKGFSGPRAYRPLMYHTVSKRKAKKEVAGQHETTNGKFKFNHLLSKTFRHDINDHSKFFFTAVVTTQMMIKRYLYHQWDVYYW